MATEPVRDHVFFVANMQQLQTLLQRIGESSCKSKLIIKGEEGACVVSQSSILRIQLCRSQA